MLFVLLPPPFLTSTLLYRLSPLLHSSNYVSPRPLLQNQQSWLFQHVEGKEERRHGSSSFCNKAEAKAVVDWLKQLRYKSSDTDWCSPERVRVITFYQGQVALIKELLRKEGLGRVLVATVDSSQGCEADLVIISFVRTCASLSSSPSSSSSSSGSGSTTSSINRTAAGEDESTTFTGKNRKNVAGFLTDDRRINVALTRAKFELICIGNRKNMSRNDNLPTLQKLAQDAENRGVTEGARPCDDHKARKKEKKRLKKDSKRSNKDNKMQQQQNDGDNDSNDGTVISPSSSVKENCYEDNRKRKEYGDAPGQEVEDVKRQKQHGSDNAGAAVLHPVMY